MLLHGSCAALDDDAVLLLGPSGAGKSDLLLRLIDRGFSLIGDDQIEWDSGRVRPAPSLTGIIEIRGLGLFSAANRTSARLRLAVSLAGVDERLPHPRIHPELAVPLITLDPAAASAAIRVHWALDAARGRSATLCGAFAA